MSEVDLETIGRGRGGEACSPSPRSLRSSLALIRAQQTCSHAHTAKMQTAALRSTRVLRQKLTNDPFAYHASDETPLWRKIRRAVVVNP